MSRTTRVNRDLSDAASVRAAREEVVQSLGQLAASPLDERAAEPMRRALEDVESPLLRLAIRRLTRPGDSRRPLVSVPLPADRSSAVRSQAPPSLRRPCQLGPVLIQGGAA